LLQKQWVYGKSVKFGFLLPESQSLPAIQPKSGQFEGESEDSQKRNNEEPKILTTIIFIFF
jgi:hypothetical protein